MKKMLVLMFLVVICSGVLKAGETKLELPELDQWRHRGRGSAIEVLEENGKKHLKVVKSNKKVVSIVHIFRPSQKVKAGSDAEITFEAKGKGTIQISVGGDVDGKYKKLITSYMKIDSVDEWKKLVIEKSLNAENIKAIAINVRGKEGNEEYHIKNFAVLIDDGE